MSLDRVTRHTYLWRNIMLSKLTSSQWCGIVQQQTVGCYAETVKGSVQLSVQLVGIQSLTYVPLHLFPLYQHR